MNSAIETLCAAQPSLPSQPVPAVDAATLAAALAIVQAQQAAAAPAPAPTRRLAAHLPNRSNSGAPVKARFATAEEIAAGTAKQPKDDDDAKAVNAVATLSRRPDGSLVIVIPAEELAAATVKVSKAGNLFRTVMVDEPRMFLNLPLSATAPKATA